MLLKVNGTLCITEVVSIEREGNCVSGRVIIHRPYPLKNITIFPVLDSTYQNIINELFNNGYADCTFFNAREDVYNINNEH